VSCTCSLAENPTDRPRRRAPFREQDTAIGRPTDTESATPGSFAWSTLLRDLADETIPRDYEERRGWGDQTEIVTGVRVREKNGLPRISKRTKRVNHGDWRRYRVVLLNPSEKLRFAIHDVHAAERGGMTFNVVVSARVRCTARSEFWSYGVRTGSATVQADATVRVVARFVVSGREVDPHDDGWFIEVEYAPDVDRVRIELDDFDVRRIGHLDGDLADRIREHAHGALLSKCCMDRKTVTKRIRRELADREASIKVSMPRARRCDTAI
jgi:hypothetical protein